MLEFVLFFSCCRLLGTRLRVEVNLVESAYVIQFVVINQSKYFVRSLEGMKMQKQNVRHFSIKKQTRPLSVGMGITRHTFSKVEVKNPAIIRSPIKIQSSTLHDMKTKKSRKNDNNQRKKLVTSSQRVDDVTHVLAKWTKR